MVILEKCLALRGVNLTGLSLGGSHLRGGTTLKCSSWRGVHGVHLREASIYLSIVNIAKANAIQINLKTELNE